QLIDARERGTLLLKNLGDKRRYLTDETIASLTREHGAFKPTDTSKLFDNEDFGYRRITVERPLRLRFQITEEATQKFLDACPEFVIAVQAVEEAFGSDPHDDWNTAWPEIQRIVEGTATEWSTVAKRLFRNSFTKVEPSAKPVIAKRGSFTGVVGPGS